jgi:ecotin
MALPFATLSALSLLFPRLVATGRQQDGARWSRSLARAGRGPGVLGALLTGVLAGAPAGAAPLPDLRPYPPAAAGERRWFIRVDAPPGTPADPAADQRVELIIGRSMRVDCNRHVLQGTLVEETVTGWGYPMFRVTGGRQVVSTRMACPGQAPRRQFVTLGGRPTLVPVNPKLPIVVVAPKDLEVRWRLWRADPDLQPASPF